MAFMNFLINTLTSNLQITLMYLHIKLKVQFITFAMLFVMIHVSKDWSMACQHAKKIFETKNVRNLIHFN